MSPISGRQGHSSELTAERIEASGLSSDKISLRNLQSKMKCDPEGFESSTSEYFVCHVTGKKVLKPSKNSKNMDIDQAKELNFPEDVLMDILSRLPVRNLLRFSCVSKFWKALISNPFFKMKHLNRAKKNEGSRKFIVTQMFPNKDKMCSFYCASLSSLWSVRLVEDAQKLDYPPNCIPYSCKIHCCRDGLCLVGVHNYCDERLGLLLWNPSTRESTVLPFPEFILDEFCTFGLGYDSTSDDYKVLKIDPQQHNEILALKSGSWKKIDEHPTGISPMLSNVDSLAFVHGAFHWLGLSPSDSAVSFSISNEVYGEIPLPNEEVLGISVLKGMLCCYTDWNYTFKLSVMKEYGVKESWQELLRIQCNRNLHSTIAGYKFADGELVLCDTRPQRFVSLFRTSKGPFGLCPPSIFFREGFVYTESLISPKLQNV